MLRLTISHYIYLSRDQRYALHNGEALEIVGTSVPVWFMKGNTSEPAKEVFCKYKLTNQPGNKIINISEEGYCINLPQKILKEASQDQIVNVENSRMSEKLLDIKDGGAEQFEFRQYNNLEKQYGNGSIVHFVEIKPIELLTETLS